MELELESESAVWCIVATLRGPSAGTAGGRGACPFEAGSKLYCFPPMRSGAYESVKAIGPDPRSNKLVAAVVPASDLEKWQAEPVRSPQILRQIAPPWDASEVSRDLARGIAAWKSGGPWPAAELRKWNRLHAQTHVGVGSVFSRLRNAVTSLLGRENS
jgi:hypothetical protein